jgi:hypothetical protein
MQTGYAGAGIREDPWTEGNAADYKVQPGSGLTLSDDNAEKVIGNQSIKIFAVLAIIPGFPLRTYWYMPFPFGAPYPPGGSKWPGQSPLGGLNTYNEVAMNETMGEINGIGFFLRTDTAFDFVVEVHDATNDMLFDSEQVHIDPGGAFSNWLNPEWVYVQLPFGPSANYKNMSNPTSNVDTPDWSNINEVRYVMIIPPGIGTLNVWFDGFRFIKPLVIRVKDDSSGIRRTIVQTASHLTSYPLAKIYAQAVLDALKLPQVYYEFQNLGRADIPVGYRFKYEGDQEFVMREEYVTFSKDEGWFIKGKGFAP